MKRVTTNTIRGMKNKEKITVLTAYDYSFAKIVDAAGCDIILVGDSLGNVCLGYPDSTRVTMDDMVSHCAAAARGTSRAHVVADMPFLSHRVGIDRAVENAGRLLSQGHAQSVKLEGGAEVADTVKAIVDAGIPVMGHLGLTPQSIHQIGGFFIQGKTAESAEKLLSDARAIEAAGAYAVVLECVPPELAGKITRELTIPTIGIGAGASCDGQVLVLHDALGMFEDYTPSFVKRFAEVGALMRQGIGEYLKEVKEGVYPAEIPSTSRF